MVISYIWWNLIYKLGEVQNPKVALDNRRYLGL